jgi:hypothetical protein
MTVRTPIFRTLLLNALLGYGLFWLARLLLDRTVGTQATYSTAIGLIALACLLPVLLMLGYYTHWLDWPWYYTFRSWPVSDLVPALVGPGAAFAAAFLGLPAWIAHLLALALVILVPLAVYAKLLWQPLDPATLENHWQDGLCLQSNTSTCGPSATATLMHHYGIQITEKAIATASHTNFRGTWNWYLARMLRRHGLRPRFLRPATLAEVPLPSIIGVRSASSRGHFLVLFTNGDLLNIGDPNLGWLELTPAEFEEQFTFANFALSVHETRRPIR